MITAREIGKCCGLNVAVALEARVEMQSPTREHKDVSLLQVVSYRTLRTLPS